jgi:hypothetical protein
MKTIKILAFVAMLSTTACVNPHTGHHDPVATGAAIGLGALAVGAIGYSAGYNAAPRSVYVAPRHHYHVPRHYYQPRIYHRPIPAPQICRGPRGYYQCRAW